MRLEPIEKPSSLLGRFLSWAMRRQLGKTITPAKVLYNRVPRMWNLSWALLRLELQGIELVHSTANIQGHVIAWLHGVFGLEAKDTY